MEKIYYNWYDIETAVDRLAYQIKTSNLEISYIKGLQRGGLIPAVLLSHKLNIPMVSNGVLDNSVLVVDDICDSGETFAEISKQYPNNKFACLHFKPHTSCFNPDLAASIFPFDDWIVYPWERDDSDAIQDYLK